MPIKCPPAPVAANPALVIQTAILKEGSALTRFHCKSRAGNIYNPNTGRRIEIEEEGARFNQFLELRPPCAYAIRCRQHHRGGTRKHLPRREAHSITDFPSDRPQRFKL